MADDIKFVIGVDDRDLVKAQKEQLKFQRNLVTIEKAYRKGDITAARYNAELAKQAKQLQALGGNYRKANSEVRKFAYQMRQADDATLAQTQAMAFAGKRVNRLGVGLQQAGYQIGDFAVQIQGGTNAAVALGQQGSQLLGIFGPAGAIAGAGLAIVTALVAPLLKAKETTKEATEALEKYEAVVRNLRGGITSEERNFVEEISDASEELSTQKELLAARLSQLERQNIEGEKLASAERENLASAKEALDVARQRLVTFRETREEAERLKREAERDASVVKQLAEARKIIADNEKKVLEEQNALQSEMVLIRTKINDVGTEGLATQELIKQKLLEQYEADWQRKGLSQQLIDSLVEQKSQAMFLADELERAEQAEERRSKIKFRDLGMSDAMLALSYEELGQSRANAPKEPPKPKKETKTRAAAKKADPLAELRKRITLEEALFKKTEAQQQVMQALGVDYEKVYGKEATDQIIGRINKIKELQKEEDKLADIAQNIGSSFESAFTSMVDGTSSVKDAFRNMARDIVAHLFKVLVMQQAINALGGMLGGSSNSVVASIGSALQSYEGGGYTGSGPRSGGMDGRGGRLAVIHPQETVVDHTKANSGVGEQIVINQSFNFQANGDDSVKKLIAQAAPQIANLTQKQIIESRKRGGTMKSAFG